MTTAIRRAFRLAALWLLVLAPAMAAMDAAEVAEQAGRPTQAERQRQQPYNNAPVWREVRSGESFSTTVRSNVPETGVLIQAGGETWRMVRNGPITIYGGILLLAVPLAILGFYAIKGPMKLHDPPTGRLIHRFGGWERLVHWTTAISFVVLAMTGLLLLFGKHLLVPLIGHSAHAGLARVSITLHNFVGPFFIVCSVAMFVTFVRDNLWKKHDLLWFKTAGGMLTGGHVPSGRFNAGEKAWFWFGVLILGVAVGATGLILDFANFGQGRTTMQLAHGVHATAAILYVAAFFGHLYMGTIGVEGSYAAMRYGYVDETWAREHHELWYREVRAGRMRGAEPKPAAPKPAVRPQPVRPVG